MVNNVDASSCESTVNQAGFTESDHTYSLLNEMLQEAYIRWTL